MQWKSYSFPSKDDVETRINGIRFVPAGEPSMVLMLAHGMQDYIGRYSRFAEYLCDRGIAVMGHDHIGHGNSVANEGELGIMHSAEAARVMVEDMLTDYRYMKDLYPNIPCFFLGHSMGSYLLRMFLSEKADQLSGLTGAIIMGTGQPSAAAIAAGKSLLNTMALIHGWDYRSEMVKRIMESQIAGHRFDHTGKNPENSWLSKDPKVMQSYQNDPRCMFVFSLNAFKVLLDAAEYGLQKENVEKVRKNLPILFISGEDDPVGNYGKGVREVAKMYKRAGMSHVALRMYKNDRHELLNETDSDQVYMDIYRWMTKGQ